MKSHAILTLLIALAVGLPGLAQNATESVYTPKTTWAETMLATRTAHLAWQERELAEGRALFGPWYATAPLPVKKLSAPLALEAELDLAAKNADGKPLWTEQPGFRDGIVVTLPGKDRAATYLYRVITAREGTKLPAGFGSDDGLRVWLNGKLIVDEDVARSAAPDQKRVMLTLQPGENQLLMKVFNRTGGHSFYFKAVEDSLSGVWEQLVRDFPREADWFASDAPARRPMAWFAPTPAPIFETHILRRALHRAGERGPLFERFSELRKESVPRTDTAWLDTYLRACRCAEGAKRLDTLDLLALQRAVDDLAQASPVYAAKAVDYKAGLARAETRIAAARESLARGEDEAVAATEQLVATLHEALFANPLLDFDRVLLVKRGADKLALPQNWQGNCAMPAKGYNNEIVLLDLATGELETVFRPERNGFVGDVDLHFDGERMLFSMPGSHGRWQIWEINVDGSGLHQVTPGEHRDVDNYDACYLPDGRIAFDSTRCFQGIPCVGGGNAVANLCLLDPSTSDIRQLCFDQDHDWCPTVMNNGRVMYTRWEYSDTPHYFSRILFSMNPDGTNQTELYGSNSFWPNSMFYARPIPDHPSQFVAIVSGHHGVPRMGELVLFDPAIGRFEADGAIQRIPGMGEKVEPIIKDQLVNDSWPRFLHPYPLSGKYFLTSCQPNPASPWGLYLVDVFDNVVALKEEPGFALFEPIPLRKTERPPLVPDKVDLRTDEATVYLADIYAGEGLRGVPRGTVKSLRVYEFHYGYPQMGGHINVGVEGAWDVHRILGTVPVLADGSAMFKAPANMPIAVQPLDERGRAIQLMRSWFTAMPGETLSCVGCHERQNQSAPQHGTLAAQAPPAEIAPWRGPARGYSFKRDLQPVLNRNCVGCHDGKVPGRPDLSPKEKNGWSNFTPAYLELHPYVRRPGPESDYHLLAPYEYYADTSPLVRMLEKGHHGVKLDEEAWDRLVTWIDLNVPDHGTWREHRAIPADFHQRRIEMRGRYANRPEDPEAIPVLAAMDDAFVRPQGVARPDGPAPSCDAWPLDEAAAQNLQTVAADARHKRVELGGGLALDLVLVPAGAFVMGSRNGCLDEAPTAAVRIEAPFWMAATETTNALFAAYDPAHHSGYLDQHHKDHVLPGYPASEPGQPAIRVSWDEAMDFCAWLSSETGIAFSLPTEAQWEWACRAGSAAPMAYGGLDADFAPFANLADASMKLLAVTGVNPQPIANPNEYADFLPKEARFDDGQRLMCATGAYRPNAWGLHDMHGNVAEWTRTAYRPYPYAEDGRNAAGNREDRVIRGGSWRDRPKHARAAYRVAYAPWRKVFNVGFRVIAPVDPEKKTEVAQALRGRD